MCVGGAGGRGSWARYFKGGADSLDMWSVGGGGGGGGMHIVAGELANLPAITSVVVGQRGVDGIDGALRSNNQYIDPGQGGQDGGFSSFGDGYL